MQVPGYNITIGNLSDVGKVRKNNEDYMAHFSTPLGYCVIVCDGMGGHSAGDIASQNAIDAIKHYMQSAKTDLSNTTLSLQNAIEFANFKLREMVKQDLKLKGMGTTCVLVLINNNKLFVAHAGDSRLYLVRNNEIKQLTRDHSVVQELVDAGALTEEEAVSSDRRNQITKAIGIYERVNPSVKDIPINLKKNDKLLLCSDGLTGHVSDQSILKVIIECRDVQQAVKKLIDSANNNGGSDNITAQLIHFAGHSVESSKRKFSIKSIVFSLILLVSLIAAFFTYRYKTTVLQKSNSGSDTKVVNTSL